ncbi:MAG TPA: hypothetical protein VNF29_07845 [Candidatus Binataceae bacterium]|nr:hypothetical protein [Candidatus Binataceae bacterium]
MRFRYQNPKKTDGGGSACPEDWEARRLYIVQAEPRNSNNS